VLLPAHCEYKGEKYEAEIPLRLSGKPFDPLEGWDEEYKKLRERIEKYSIPEDKDQWLQKLEEISEDPRPSTAQLRLTSKYIIRQYMRYWTIEGIKYRNDAELYDVIINQLEWVKFVGDCAFSFLVNAYAGPVAEALISPAKDYIAESLGELIACWNHGTAVNPENFGVAKSLESMADNLMSNNIKFTDWKKAAATLSAYFVYSSLKNYLATWREKGQSDVWGSLCKGFSDMTAQGLKAAAGACFEKWIQKNKTAQKWISENITKHLNKYAGRGRTFNLKDQKIKNVQYELNDSLKLEGKLRELAGFQGESKKVAITKVDIAGKYLTELVGKYAGEVKEVVDKTSYRGSEFSIGEHGHIIFNLLLTEEDGPDYEYPIDLTAMFLYGACPLFDLLYEELFSGIPCAAAVLEVPKDPPLPPAKN
jgi:hypothetical protein